MYVPNWSSHKRFYLFIAEAIEAINPATFAFPSVWRADAWTANVKLMVSFLRGIGKGRPDAESNASRQAYALERTAERGNDAAKGLAGNVRALLEEGAMGGFDYIRDYLYSVSPKNTLRSEAYWYFLDCSGRKPTPDEQAAMEAALLVDQKTARAFARERK